MLYCAVLCCAVLCCSLCVVFVSCVLLLLLLTRRMEELTDSPHTHTLQEPPLPPLHPLGLHAKVPWWMWLMWYVGCCPVVRRLLPCGT